MSLVGHCSTQAVWEALTLQDWDPSPHKKPS